MRFTRIMTALVAVFTAAMLGLTTAPAQATVRTQPVAVEAAAKPSHVVTYFSSGKVPGTRATFYAKGRLPYAKGQRVYLQALTRAKPYWRTIKSMASSTSTGRFAFTFTGPCPSRWRIVIKETATYARTVKSVGRIYCS